MGFTFGFGFGLGAKVCPGAGVNPGARVGDGPLGFGLGVLYGFGAGVGRFLQTGVRQHGSLGSVSRVHPAGTCGYLAHLSNIKQ